ncbi:P27 family phage terminase small subunit [Eremococcus coleocola]|uniref:P27 family phage terminase small subunit n=1 Tax=Eremococcus coleocola TaxID=88132 RepID=UPI0004013C47|nr:P27 family phage terminase small subunit [Eremococcus coleocola]
MAKDGTNRGGARIGAGRKKDVLVDKINSDKIKNTYVLPQPEELSGQDMPPISDYLKQEQKNGEKFYVEEVYEETWRWLKIHECEHLVSKQLIEQYAMMVSRWIQCEQAISEFGFLAKHPTTGNAIASPYVSMSKDYMKQINNLWYQIYQVVRENASVAYDGPNPKDDLMEKLLRSKK